MFIFCDDRKPSKVGQSDLVLGYGQGSSVGLCVQDYKSLCAAVAICNTQTDTQTID